MTEVPMICDGAPRLTTATMDGCRWLEQLQLWQPEAVDQITTGEHETAVVLLAGTFDLMAGSTSWPARGARKAPFAGRPMAVFLPPNTPFRVGNEAVDGEILMIAARQPEVGPEPEGQAALSAKPLLPMAGSGKSYDPATGEWKPAESFPTAAESLPPRRFEKLPIGNVTIERIFSESYKAATISVDEAVIPAGSSLSLKDIPARPTCEEVLLFARPQATSRIALDGECQNIDTDCTHVLSNTEADQLTIYSDEQPTYIVIAYAGKSKD